MLCLVLCEDRIQAAGVDPRIISIKHIVGLAIHSPHIVLFEWLICLQAGNDFRVVQKRNGPVRDVRAMATFDEKVSF